MKNLGALLVSFLFTTIVVAGPINVTNLGDDNETTVSSIEATTQKRVGQVVYNCGTILCEGVKKAFHSNGQLQIIGTFEKGIAVDTLKEFAADGQIIRLFHPSDRNGFEKQFYPKSCSARFM